MKKYIFLFISLAFVSGCTVRRVKSGGAIPRKTTPTDVVKSNTQVIPPLDQDQSKFLRQMEFISQLEKKGSFSEAFQKLLVLEGQNISPEQQRQVREKALDILTSRLSEVELKKIHNETQSPYWRSEAAFQLGRNAKENGDTGSARSYFGSILSMAPGSDLAFQAETEIATLDRYRTVESKTIGAILPLTGKSAYLGQRYLRGLQMGLGIQDANSPFRLAVIDSAGNPDQARRAVERLANEDNVIAIVGGTTGKTALSEAEMAQELGVPFIALSQKSGLTTVGPAIFRNSLTSEMLVRELVKASMEVYHIQKFALLYPNDAYGIEYANVFWDEVLARGGQITAVQTYDPSENDFRPVAQRLVGTFYVEGREDEFKMILRDQKQSKEKSKKSSRQEANADDILPPRVNFDAIFIPDNVKMMTQLTAFLSFVGVRNVRILGTNLWGNPGLAKKAGHFSEQLLYVDQRLPEQTANKEPRFFQEYKQLFSEGPGLAEVQSYDTALLLRGLIIQGASDRVDMIKKLAGTQSFPGTLGPMTMSAQRELKRPLFGVTYNKGLPVVIHRE